MISNSFFTQNTSMNINIIMFVLQQESKDGALSNDADNTKVGKVANAKTSDKKTPGSSSGGPKIETGYCGFRKGFLL